jgi:hypothetical protein
VREAVSKSGTRPSFGRDAWTFLIRRPRAGCWMQGSSGRLVFRGTGTGTASASRLPGAAARGAGPGRGARPAWGAAGPNSGLSPDGSPAFSGPIEGQGRPEPPGLPGWAWASLVGAVEGQPLDDIITVERQEAASSAAGRRRPPTGRASELRATECCYGWSASATVTPPAGGHGQPSERGNQAGRWRRGPADLAATAAAPR